MPWLIAVLIGIAAGALSGLAAGYTGWRPVVQSGASAMTALLMGAVAMILVWSSWPGVSNGYFSIGVDNLFNVLAFLAVVLALHVLLGFLPEPVSAKRPLMLGAVGGLCGALAIAWLMVVLSRLQ